MEIPQNIWTALTTENEVLTNILFVPLMIIEMYITMLIFTTLLNIKASLKQRIIYMISVTILGNITNFFIISPFNMVLNVIFFVFAVMIIFKQNIFKAILCEILPYSVFVLIGVIVHNIYINVFNFSTSIFTKIPIFKLFSSLMIYLIVYIIYLALHHLKININLLDITNKAKNNKILLFNFVLGIISITVQSYIASLYCDKLPPSVFMINLAALFLYFISSIYSLLRTNKLEATKIDLEQSKQYINTLTLLHDKVRCIKHDYSNTVTTIGGYIQTNNMEGLKKYYEEMLADCQKINNLSTLNPDVVNEPAIYNLLASKYHLADEKGISINLEVFLDLTTLNIKIYEFTKILGILMDNAIQAAEQCEEKQINVIIRKDFHQQRQLLIIENTYLDKDIDTEKIYEKGYSTKAGNTGLGLWEIRQILKRHNNLNLFTSKDEKYFKQQFEIYL